MDLPGIGDPFAALQQQASQAGSQAAQGAVQQLQTALPGLVDAANQQATTAFQGLIAQASQAIPGLVAQGQQAATPAAYALGQQASAGAASGLPDPTTVIVVAGVAVVGLVGLAAYLGSKASRVNALSEHPMEGEWLGEYRRRLGRAGADTAMAERVRWEGGRWVRHPAPDESTGRFDAVEAPTASQVAAVHDVFGNRLTSTTQGLLALAEIHERYYEDPVGAGMLRNCAERFAAHDAEG